MVLRIRERLRPRPHVSADRTFLSSFSGFTMFSTFVRDCVPNPGNGLYRSRYNQVLWFCGFDVIRAEDCAQPRIYSLIAFTIGSVVFCFPFVREIASSNPYVSIPSHFDNRFSGFVWFRIRENIASPYHYTRSHFHNRFLCGFVVLIRERLQSNPIVIIPIAFPQLFQWFCGFRILVEGAGSARKCTAVPAAHCGTRCL
ncbi:hypothetical protein AVEN_125024-1 [Araneus ventricosus]|uniref:Uncharacterized protein n=1 Tax=Araneus ventricosus TaxID=182803 RepID=A0A4Y2GWI1_ARAVE|nr:hypothetical protein AVEN_125024-1 [Araneus ventricosus]